MTGQIFSISFFKITDFREFLLEFIQLILPLTVLISPLWHRYLKGCANFQEGNVLVENL